MATFKLRRTKQCAKCPWKVATNPHEIPNGYTVAAHKNLSCTIRPGLDGIGRPVQAMACHESYNGNEDYCIGWLNNQLGVGNNIALRLKMMNCENIMNMKVVGAQHQKFEDTLP